MKDLRSKKAIAASLSLTLALGSVPAVALADNADEGTDGAAAQSAAQEQNLEVIGFFQGGARNGSEVLLSAGGVSPKDSVAQYVHDCDGYTLQTMSANAATGPELYMTSSLEGVTSIYVYYMAKDQAEQQPEQVKTTDLRFVAIFQGGEKDGTSEEFGSTQGTELGTKVSDAVPAHNVNGYTFDGYACAETGTGLAADDEIAEGMKTIYAYYNAKDQAEQQPEVETQDLKVIGFFRGGALDGDRELLTAEGVDVRDSFAQYVHDYDGYTLDHMSANEATGPEVNMTDSVKGTTTVYVYYNADEQTEQQPEVETQDLKVIGFFRGGALDGDRELLTAEGVDVRDSFAQYVHDYDGYTLDHMSANEATGPEVNMTDSVKGTTTVYVYYNADEQTEQQPEQAKTTDLHFVAIFQGGEKDGTNEEFGSTQGTVLGTKVSDAVPGHNVAGYTFDGYACAETGADLAADDEIAEGMKTIYVYYKADEAKADEMHQHVVNYDFNDGTDSRTATFNVPDSEMEKGFAGWLNVYQPQRDGYEFLGWAWKDGDGSILAADTPMPNTDTVDVVAQWKAADVQAEQITVKFVDNFNETESSTEVKKGEAVAKPADPTYDGWTFEGWSSTLKDDEGNWEYTPVDFSKAVEDEDQDGVVTYYAFYSENQAAADNTANGEEAAGQEAAGDDANAADESSIAPQTGDATNVAAVAGIGGIAGLLAAAAALLRRRRNN